MASPAQVTQKIWRPHRVQEEFLRLPSSIFEAFYGGQAAGGKSDILLMYPIVKKLYLNPQFNGAIFRRTFPELEESLIQKSDTGIGYQGPTYWDFGGKYDRSKHVWTFFDDRGNQLGKIRFLYSQRESDVLQHDTAEFHYLGIDELTHFTWYQYSYLMHRCRSTVPSITPTVRTASNPGNIGHTWVFKRFIEPCRTGRKILYSTVWDKVKKENREVKRIFIPAKATDNPFLAKVDPDYVLRLNLLPEAERKAKMEGDWDAFAGQVFTEFRVKQHDGEPENALHVVPAFEIPRWWPKMLILDWGFEAMTYAMWVAVSPWRRTYQYREYSCRRKSIIEWGADIQRLSQQDGIGKGVEYAACVVDPSANKRLGAEKTLWEQIIAATGLPFELGDNDRIGGIAAVHDLLRWKPKPARFDPAKNRNQDTADRIFRLYGSDALKEYEKLFLEDVPESDLPLFQIFDTCPTMIQTIPTITYAENKASGKKAEDYAEFDGDDPMDTLRYCAKRVDAFFKDSASKWLRYQKMDRAITEFKRSQNYNDLDRSLTLVEKEGDASHSSVPRGGFREYLLARTRGKHGPRRGRSNVYTLYRSS
jgi:hypothetical protein